MEDGTYILNDDNTLTRVVHRDGYYVDVAPYIGQALTERQYIDVWTDPADGKVYTDVSEHWQSRAAATIKAENRGELAIWDVARGAEILTSHGLQARVDAGQPFDIIVPA